MTATQKSEKRFCFHRKGFDCYYLEEHEFYVIFYNDGLAELTYKDFNFNDQDYYGFSTELDVANRIDDFYSKKKWERIA